ncbi:FtsX-like permease family protein, partial [Angustibacter aerolatus]
MSARTSAAGWRVARRIALRELLRNKARNALVVVLVGVPVLLTTLVATVYATDQVSAVENLPFVLGTTQAELKPQGRQPVQQDATLGNFGPAPDAAAPAPGAVERDWTPAEMQRLTGGSVLELREAGTAVRTERGRLQANLLLRDTADPRLAPTLRLVDGRLPRSDGEALVSRSLVARGFGVGHDVTVGAATLRVVGVSDASSEGFARYTVVARPGAAVGEVSTLSPRYLLDRPAPVTWAQVRELNRAGLLVLSRAVVEHPPATTPVDGGGGDAQARAVLVLLVFSIVLEVVLLAGPAFAVGVRRQQRQLALLAAAGATPRDVRRVVLAQALLSGVLASVLGSALGVAAAAVTVRVLPALSPTTVLGPFDVDWRSTLAASALGALASLAAAALPARTAARLD